MAGWPDRLSFRAPSAITRPLAARLIRAAVAVAHAQSATLVVSSHFRPTDGFCRCLDRVQESQMPKLKTKSGAKKRFKITGSGKVVAAQAGKRHGMIKRTTKQIRDLRGTRVLFKSDGDNIKKYWMPNG
jgi:large subunit ribosomal protein L35